MQRLFLTFVLVSLALAAPVHAEPASGGLRALCFAPQDLSARTSEKLPVKHQHGFDRPAPARELAPFSAIPSGLRGAIRRVELPPGSPKLIALTFDLCEQPGEIAGYDGAIVDYLRAHNIKATMFVGGKWMRSHAARTQQIMSDPLFELGSHAEAHRNLRSLKGRALSEEIAGPQRTFEAFRSELMGQQCVAAHGALAAKVPARIGTFRFPYGACNPEALNAVNEAGLLAIQWDLSTGDPSPAQSARAIANAALRAKPGSILIMHANGRGHHTAEALPLFLPKLKDQGFQFVTVSELLAAGKPVVVSSCYNAKPGDTDRYDMPFLAQRPVAQARKPKP